MKISLVLHPSRPLTRREAWGCFTANLALPGSGSLVAGRAVGYFQLALTAVGFIVSVTGAVSFIHWYLLNAKDLNNVQDTDLFGPLVAILRAALPAMTGVGIFAVAMAWACLTSWQILKASPK